MTSTAARRALRYEPPDILWSFEDLERVWCTDVPTMSDRELFSERQILDLAITAEIRMRCKTWISVPWSLSQVPYIEWLEDRLGSVDAEIRRRRDARR